MRKILGLIFLLVLLSLACNTSRLSNSPLVQAILPATETPLPPTSTPTTTPTPTPPPTPTPLPGMRVAEGEHALFNGDWDAARSAFQNAYDATTDQEVQAPALVGLGKTYLMSGDDLNALNTLRSMLEAFPDSIHAAEGYFLLGQTYANLDRPQDSADSYQRYLDLRPGVLNAYVQEQRGNALTNVGDSMGALSAYLAALAGDRSDSSLPLEVKIAQTYADLGDYPTSLLMYDDIYQRSSSDFLKAQVDLLKGRAAQASGQTDVANAAYLDAVLYYPLAYDSYQALVALVNAGYPVDELQRGIIDYYAGEYVVALAAIDRYLAAAPADPGSAYYYRGLILRATEDYVGALDSWSQVIQNYPTSPQWDDAWEQKAYTQWAYLDDYVAGKQTLVDFVATAANHARAAEFLFDAAQVAERGANLDEAAILWRRVGFEFMTSAYAFRGFFLAGITDYRRGDLPTALDDFNRAQLNAVEVEDRAAAFLWMGKVQQALGDAATAQATWQQAAELDPTGYYSERARELKAGRTPFTPPDNFGISRDLNAERLEAEAWMRTIFTIAAEVNLSSPGELVNDSRFQRGDEFLRLGLFDHASAEFESLRMALQADPINTYRLANYLVDLGFYRSAILAARQVLDAAGLTDATTLTAPDLFNHIRFGTYYSEMVIPAAQENGYHPLLVWSMMRQESFFERGAASSAGARGLMQIIPSTGEEVAARMGWPPGYTAADLDRPLVSINMGLNYLARQQDYLGGDLLVALAAYNGGAGNASIWKELGGGDPDLFVEVIRLSEPRDYIRRIYENYQIYMRLYAHIP